jgi:hypothetical protein
MNRLAIVTVIASLFAMGCKSDSSGTSPSGTTSGTTTFTMQLAASNETPAVSNAEGSVTGNATIALHVTKDGSGTVTGSVADFQMTAAGFPAGSQLTMAHIHLGVTGVAGAIVVDTGLAASGGVTPSGGTASFQKTGVNVSPDIAQAILNNPGGYYFNIHTSLNPAGVARGQVNNGSGGAPPTVPDPNPIVY